MEEWFKSLLEQAKFYIFNGTWYLFLVSFAIYIISIANLFLFHDYHLYALLVPDMINNAATIKAVTENGLFGKIPQYMNGRYAVFGSMPPLSAVIGAAINLFLGDAILSTFILNFIVWAATVILLDRFFFSTMNWRSRLIILSALTINLIIGAPFPFIWRIRQFLAMFFGIALFSLEPRKELKYGIVVFLLSFLMFISHLYLPLLIAVIYATSLLSKYRENIIFLLPLLGGALAALPFYGNLLNSLFETPSYVGCGFGIIYPSTRFIIYLFGVLIILYELLLHKQKDRGIHLVVAAVIYLIPLLFYIVLYAMPHGFLKTIVFILVAQVCTDAYTTALIFFMIGLYRNEKSMHQTTIFLLTLFAGFSLLYVAGLSQIDMSAESIIFDDILHTFHENGITNVATAGFYIYDEIVFYEFPIFRLDDYIYLKNSNITFAETTIPPQLSKGNATRNAVALFYTLVKRVLSCKDYVKILESENVNGLVYAVYGNTRNTLYNESKNALTDQNYIMRCGLKPLKNYSDVFIYKVE